jgi:hypothetical protein
MRVQLLSILALAAAISALPTANSPRDFDPYAYQPGHGCDGISEVYGCTLEGDVVVCSDSPLGRVWQIANYCWEGSTCESRNNIVECYAF